MQHSHLYHLHIMVKSDADVIKEFNELVNMTASELEKWLKSNDSTSSGWTDGEGGETVGHNSGTKIVDILERNPEKNKEKYTEDDIKHMRKVVSYNKRHLAQEQHLKQKKSNEELQKTKSYKSLKSKFAPSCPLWALVSDLVWFGLVGCFLLLLLLGPCLLWFYKCCLPSTSTALEFDSLDNDGVTARRAEAPRIDQHKCPSLAASTGLRRYDMESDAPTLTHCSYAGGSPDTTWSSASSSTFRSDVALPTALNLGKIGTSATTASTAAASAAPTRSGDSAAYLDSLEEGVNKTIDAEVDTLLSSYKELVSLATVSQHVFGIAHASQWLMRLYPVSSLVQIADKDKYRVAQEAFQSEARADIMVRLYLPSYLVYSFLTLSVVYFDPLAQVRSTQTLSLLSEALKLSLLLSKTADPALNTEAMHLIESTEAEKLQCAHLLSHIMQLDVRNAQHLVSHLDRALVDPTTRPEAHDQSQLASNQHIPDDDMQPVSTG